MAEAVIARRSFLAGILASGIAPATVGSGILMPVRRVVTGPWSVITFPAYPEWPKGIISIPIPQPSFATREVRVTWELDHRQQQAFERWYNETFEMPR